MGSQLAQLKSSLSKAGVTSQPQSGKKRKRSSSSQETKQSNERKAARLEEISRRLNPFDIKVTKLKHEHGGRKIKGVSGKPAISKQAGIDQRKNTLLKELKLKNRAGGILDRRFGENDPSLSLEERMLERFTRERQRSSKSSAFNLEDDEELTHYGQSLSKLDDFDDFGFEAGDDDEDAGGKIDASIVRKQHFKGFDDDEKEEDEPERKKSKAEVMAEVIAKSKEHKLLRQMERDHEDNIRHELDSEFANIKDLLFAPDPSSSGSNSVPLGQRRPEEIEPASAQAQDDYDVHVRELAFDKRAKAKDRTKTEEEIALEEKEALEAAERKRRKRMLGEEDGSDEEDARGRRKRQKGGDDLEDDFHGDVLDELGVGLQDDISANTDDESLSEDKQFIDEENSEESEDEADEADGTSSEDEYSADTDAEQEELVSASRKSKKASSTSNELPYTFPCPSTHEELLEIIEPLSCDDIPTVIQRIRTLYHPSLSPDNKSKLQTLATILIDHILYITSPPILSKSSFPTVSSLVPHLSSLTRSYPIPSAVHCMHKLGIMHKNLKRGLSKGAIDPESKTFPGISELSFLRLIGFLWSTSDLNHAVISPARVLMGAYLGLCRVRSISDLASGLFLCTLVLQYESLSKRYFPEAMNFLVNTILHLASHGFKDVTSVPGTFPCPDFQSELCQSLKIKAKEKNQVVVTDKLNLVELLSNPEASIEKSKVDMLALTFDLIGRFADMYKSLPAFVELFDPIRQILESIDDHGLPADGLAIRKTKVQETITRLLKHSTQSRQLLQLQAHKPIPIPSYIPKFESSSSNYLRRKDPDHERNEAAKLRNQYKQEKKGAIRELRKDARFLSEVQQQEMKAKDKTYSDRMKRVFGEIEGERAEEKKMQREKMKEKKRAGRK